MDAPRLTPDSLLESSALALARLIRTGAVSARAVCEAHLARIREVNPGLNAVVADRAQEALREADAADQAVRTRPERELPPLHGVPCTVKESFAVRGMPNTSGLLARKDVVAQEDAPTVARLRAAGALVLGVTNVSELCLWMESDNRVWGRTNNPYDARRTVGGSSGGEGAIVGAGGSPFGLGADIGGSIRMPAFFNGVFGHKPSPGLVPNDGQYPAPPPGARMLGTGPLARRAEDLPLLLSVLAGRPPASLEPWAAPASAVRVLVVEGDGRTPVAPELLTAQREAAGALRRRGCRVATLRVDGFEHAFEMWTAAMAEVSDQSFAELLGQGQPLDPLTELARYLVGRSPYTLPAVGLLALENVLERLSSRRQKALARAAALEQQVLALLGDDAVILYPPHPTTAPLHGRPLLYPTRFAYTGLFNVLGLAVTQVPLGLDSQGVPLGVQVATCAGNDGRSMAVARWLEQDFGGWQPPWHQPAAGALRSRRPAAHPPGGDVAIVRASG